MICIQDGEVLNFNLFKNNMINLHIIEKIIIKHN